MTTDTLVHELSKSEEDTNLPAASAVENVDSPNPVVEKSAGECSDVKDNPDAKGSTDEKGNADAEGDADVKSNADAEGDADVKDTEDKDPEKKNESESEESAGDSEENLPPSLIAESAELKARLKERRAKEDAVYEEELALERQRKTYIEPKPEALKQKLHDLRVIIPEAVREDWVERLVLVTPKPVVLNDPNDDFERESVIYKATLECVVRGIEKVKHLDKLKMRPHDFYADMVKSDRHMKRVKARVLSEKKAISIVEQRRHNRGGAARNKTAKKQMKQMQIGIEQNRIADAKQNIRALKEWRKDAQRNESTLLKAIKGQPKRKMMKRPSIKRQRKNEKYGKGGLKRFKKTNTRESTNDPYAFNPYVNSGKRSLPKPPTWKQGGNKNKRPGKAKRQLNRFKRRRKK